MTEGGALPRRQRPPRFADTKFMAPPPAVGVARRGALRDRLDAAAALPATVVVGAVGAGKTSLLTDWFRDLEPGTGVWISADRGDADPIRFWRGLIAGVQRLDPTFGADASDIITLDSEVTADALESLLVDESVLDRRITVVIDDTHLVAADALEQLGQLIERRPANLRFVLGGRTEPAIGLARLRMIGLVSEIRDADLRFDIADIRAMFERIGLDDSGVDLADLHRRTEGWAAGVQLAALSVVGSPDPAARLKTLTGTHATIASFLVDEVLANQPAHIHEFLELTCVLDELDAAMCEAMLAGEVAEGGADSQTVLLREVEAANLFLTRVDDAGTTFRYHQLFADLLRDQLRSRDPARFRRQHQRAAHAYIASGQPVRAVQHLWKSGDRDGAAQIIAKHPLSVYLSASEPPPLDLLDYINDEDLLRDAYLVGGYAMALVMNARAREASDLITRVDQVVGLHNLTPSERMNLLSLQAGARLQLGDTAMAAHNVRLVCDVIDRGEASTDEWFAVSIPVGMRAAAWEGDLVLADRIASHFPPGHHPHLQDVDFVAAKALVEYVRGDVRGAIRLATMATKAAVEHDIVGSGSDIAAQAILGAALVDRGDVEAAEPHIGAVLDTARIERVPSIVLATLARSRILRARGDYDGALAAIAVARSRFSEVPSSLGNYLDLAEYMVVGALREMKRTEEITARVIDPLLAGRMRSWTKLVNGLVDDAAKIAEALVELAVTPRQKFELTVLRARVAFEMQSDRLGGLIDELVEMSEVTGLLQHIGEGGTGILEECRRVARLRPRSDAMESLALMQPLPRPAHRVLAHHPLDELSAREQIVLRYMATAMSNQEIAAQLFLSVNTVKTHIKNVLRKMHASTRQQAVERARQLNYL